MGNITEKLTYLEDTKTAIKDAIIAKGVAVPEETTFREYADKISEIVGTTEIEGEGEFLVRFIDYDGTVLKQQRVQTGQNATAPQVPEHDYLVFDMWSDPTVVAGNVLNVTNNMNIGAIYHPVDGKSHIFITLSDITGTYVQFNFSEVCTGLFIEWGDGTDDYYMGPEVVCEHTYSNNGEYVIRVEDGVLSYVFGSGLTPFSFDGKIITKIYFGSQITTILQYQNFDQFWDFDSSLTEVVIPISVTTIGDNVFLGCYQLKAIIFPPSITSQLGVNITYSCINIRELVLPYFTPFLHYGIFDGLINLTNIVIPDQVLYLETSSIINCSALTSVTFPSVNSIIWLLGDYVFGGCSALRSVTLPPSITTINMAVFTLCYSLREVIIKAEIPPTLADTTSFFPLRLDFRIYVPDNSVADYKAATNWINIPDYIYPLSSKP